MAPNARLYVEVNQLPNILVYFMRNLKLFKNDFD